MPTIPLSVQLYTLRNEAKQDFVQTVQDVARIGYSGVELAGYGNLSSAQEVRKAVEDAGLKVVGSHIGIDKLEKDLNQVFEENQTLGNRNIVCPFLAEDRRKTADDWKRTAEVFNRVAAECQRRGFNFAYHNHSFEFQKFDGLTGLEILFNSSDAKLVKSELDVYWVRHGEQDPVAFLNKLGSRVLLLHLKDMAPGAERRFAPVGSGVLDFRAIVEAGQKAGVEAYIVEQDNCYETPPIEAVRTSYENLKKLGLV